jgi:hypothetical protein
VAPTRAVLYLSRTARAHLETGDLDAACAIATEVFTQKHQHQVRPRLR